MVADDNKAIRDNVVMLLQPEFEVIGTATDGNTACEAVALLSPEVVVLDISMPGKNGIEAAEEIRMNRSDTKTVFLTVHSDPDYVSAAMNAGASAYVVKSQMASDLVIAINSAVEGKLFVSPSIAVTD